MADPKVSITSGRGTLNWKDAINGTLMAGIGSGVGVLIEVLDKSGFSGINWKTVGIISLGSALSYLMKNVFKPTSIVISNVDKDTMRQAQDGGSITIGDQQIK